MSSADAVLSDKCACDFLTVPIGYSVSIAMYCSGKSSPNSIDLRINKLEMRYWAKGYSGTIYSDILCMPFTGLSSQWVPVVKPENIKAEQHSIPD